MERSELWVPKTRSEIGVPDKPHHEIDWDEYIGDTPLYSLFLLIRHQLLAFPSYISKRFISLPYTHSNRYDPVFNMSGQKRYGKWSNHLNR